MTDLRDDKPLWGVGEVLRFALPAAAGMINITIMQFVDGLMVARLIGPEALSAQFVAGILAWVPMSLALGICGVVNTFVAQNLGAGRRRQCGRYAWSGLYLAAIFSAAMVPLAVWSREIFGALAWLVDLMGGRPTADGELGMQTVYFRYLTAGASMMLMGQVMRQFFFGTHRPGVVYVVSLIAVAVNIVLNYALITGSWGFPALGLKGAAIATVIGRAVSFVLPLALFLGRANHRKYRTRIAWRPRAKLLRDLLRVGWPMGMQFFNDVLAWSLFITVFVGYFGVAHKAASAAVMRYIHISFMPAMGISVACTALVGRYIGQGRADLARRRTHAGVAVAVAYMGLCGLGLFIFRYPLVELFAKVPSSMQASAAEKAALHAEIVGIGAKVMICAAVFQCFDAVGIAFIGALRGAGDTFWPMVVTFVLSWGIIVGGGAAAVGWAPQWTSIGPWVAASLYVIVLGLLMAWRFESGAWRKIDLLGRKEAVQPFPAAPLSEIAASPDPPAANGSSHE